MKKISNFLLLYFQLAIGPEIQQKKYYCSRSSIQRHSKLDMKHFLLWAGPTDDVDHGTAACGWTK